MLQLLKNDDKFNITTIALINVENAKRVHGDDVNLNDLSEEEWKTVLPYYNSSMKSETAIKRGNDYANLTSKYFEPIRRLLE